MVSATNSLTLGSLHGSLRLALLTYGKDNHWALSRVESCGLGRTAMLVVLQKTIQKENVYPSLTCFKQQNVLCRPVPLLASQFAKIRDLLLAVSLGPTSV